ncbi:MAG: glycosyltransferase family 2 protein [Gemmatimonadota bacterium]
MSSGLTLCIVNHDGERYLPDTLAAVTRGVQPFEEIVLVDNASTDGSLDIVRQGFPRVRIVRLATNRGPGAARNAGAREAAHHRILFIDNDVVLLRGCAELLSAALDAREEATFAMPAVVHAKEGSTVQYDGAGAHFIGLMIVENAGLPVTELPADPRAIDSLITACFLMDRRRWGDEPPFDETFFFYLEDHDLGLRTRLRGQDIVAVPAARCLHREGEIGVSLRQTGVYTATRVRNTILNRWLILLKIYEARTLLLLSPALLSFEAFQLVGAMGKGWTRYWLDASAGLMRNLSTIVLLRRSFQRVRRLGDGDVLAGGPLPFNPALSSGRLERAGRVLLDRIAAVNWSLAHRFLRRSSVASRR